MRAYVIALILSFLVVPLMKLLSMTKKMQDTPNHRSLHTTPVGRGGGIAIVISFLLGIWFHEDLIISEKVWFVAICMGISLIGFLDDMFSVKSIYRLCGHIALSFLFLYFVEYPTEISLFSLGVWQGNTVALFFIGFLVWFTNLYNFMDGSDGLTASQAAFVAIASGAISWWNNQGTVLPFFVLGLSLVGFFIFNWHPAKIFMGDVGSSFLGFTLGGLALLSEVNRHMPGYISLILNATFITDATLTLAYRILNRQKFDEAHRTHMYQKAILGGKSHKQVALFNLYYNTLWLFPMAVLSIWRPQLSVYFFLAAYLPPIILWQKLKGGRIEERSTT